MDGMIVKRSNREGSDREAFIAAMWLMFLRTPCRNTKPGEPVDLGEIGEVREKNWTKATPYSPAQQNYCAIASTKQNNAIMLVSIKGLPNK